MQVYWCRLYKTNLASSVGWIGLYVAQLHWLKFACYVSMLHILAKELRMHAYASRMLTYAVRMHAYLHTYEILRICTRLGSRSIKFAGLIISSSFNYTWPFNYVPIGGINCSCRYCIQPTLYGLITSSNNTRQNHLV